MWLSRSALPVSIELRSIVAVTWDSSGFSPVTTSPLNVVNLPRTLLTIMCRTEKPTSEWTGSIVQVPATYPGSVSVAMLISSLHLWLTYQQSWMGTKMTRQLFPEAEGLRSRDGPTP